MTGEQRKGLVATVNAFADAPAVYQSAPTFAYAIGEYSVDKGNHFMHAEMWIPAKIPYKKLVGSRICRITKEPIPLDKLFCTNECRYSCEMTRKMIQSTANVLQ